MTILLHKYKIQIMTGPYTKIILLKYLDHISVHVCDIMKSMNTQTEQ